MDRILLQNQVKRTTEITGRNKKSVEDFPVKSRVCGLFLKEKRSKTGEKTSKKSV